MTFITSYLCRYFDKSSPELVEIARRVLRYLKGTRTLGITYLSNSPETTVAFSDADHGSDPEDRISVSGTLIMRQSGPVIWHSTKQSNISLSSMESEFYACSETLKSVSWLNKLLSELNIHEKITIFMDSQSAIAIIKNPALYRRSKHIELKHCYVKEAYQKGKINIEFVPTLSQRADGLTKPLTKPTLLEQRKLINLQSW